MAKEDVIRGVICPDCGKEMYRHVVNSISRNSCPNENSTYYDWRCVDCVPVYTELWLRDKRFCDFPELICLYEDLRSKVYHITAFREANLIQFQKCGLKFKDWFKNHQKDFEKFKVPRI